MSKKGRRLKRYLGLSREAGSGHSGGIEHLMPGRISGWVVANKAEMHEVRLLVGPHLIARAEINQPRPDVCEVLGWRGQPGFALVLPGELPQLDWTQPPRLLALSADGSVQVELGLLQKGQKTAERLKALLQSDALGLDGHSDGFQHGKLQGWAGRRGQQQPAQIWLQASGLESIPVRCDQSREGMQALGLPDQCGFRLDPKQLPSSWGSQEVWFSFDQQGHFRLPQDHVVVLPGSPTAMQVRAGAAAPEEITVYGPDTYQERIHGAPEDQRVHWEALEQFRLFLDGLEDELNRFDVLRASPQTRKGWRALQKGRGL